MYGSFVFPPPPRSLQKLPPVQCVNLWDLQLRWSKAQIMWGKRSSFVPWIACQHTESKWSHRQVFTYFLLNFIYVPKAAGEACINKFPLFSLHVLLHLFSLSGVQVQCNSCKTSAIPQYHLAMSDGSIRNFCSYSCVVAFQVHLKSQSCLLTLIAPFWIHVSQGKWNAGICQDRTKPHILSHSTYPLMWKKHV